MKKKLHEVMGKRFPSDNDIGLNILELLEECDVRESGISALATMTGLDRGNLHTAIHHDYYVRKFERKRRLTVEMLMKIAAALGVSTQTLLRKRDTK